MFAQAEQQLMIPRGDAVIAQLTTDATTTDQSNRQVHINSYRQNSPNTCSRCCISINNNKEAWKKTVADFYHVTERTLHLISQIESCLHPCVQLYLDA